MRRHGTVAAYWRHHRSGSTPCPACKKAWSGYVSERRKQTRGARPSDFSNVETKAMDAALEANPPVIVWEQRKGILRHVLIQDPHADAPNRKQTRKKTA